MGTECIEYTSGLHPEFTDLFVRKGIAIVPTLENIENFLKFVDVGAAKFGKYAAHIRDLYARRFDIIATTHEAGVLI